MRDKLIFLCLAGLTALVLSCILASTATLIGYLAGGSDQGLVTIFASTGTGVFTATIALAALVARVMGPTLPPRRRRNPGVPSNISRTLGGA